MLLGRKLLKNVATRKDPIRVWRRTTMPWARSRMFQRQLLTTSITK
jgi:hypothetical protein